ncbi:hypothetical protein AVEN_53545-1 [Araneus ventricosus]|uniref:MATH domain-containing protein n=1 Tax=Araneus ventricosus TaxID=182803 RepID=A0A4Y2X552_ARAVE|nr:hypothetical protein AVEN_53545-1 [Araneus ventricosus]
MSDEYKGYITLYFGRNPVDDGPEEISLNFELSVLASDRSSHRSSESKFAFKNNFGFLWTKFVKMDDVSQDILTMRCRIWKGEGKVHKFAPICARTRIAVENISFLHVVENFSTVGPNQKKIVELRSHSKKRFVVSSCLYFTCDTCDEGEIIVKITPSYSHHILCERKMFLFDASGNIVGCGESDNRSDAEGKDIQKLPLSITRQVILNKKNEFLKKIKYICFVDPLFPRDWNLRKSKNSA